MSLRDRHRSIGIDRNKRPVMNRTAPVAGWVRLFLVSIIALLAASPLISGPVVAADPPPAVETPGSDTGGEPASMETPEEEEQTYGEMADDFHESIAEQLSESADWVDSFFQDERVEIEENKTSLRVRLSTFLEDGEGVDFKARVRLKLRLPRFEDKMYFVVYGDRDDDSTATRSNPLNDLIPDEESDNDLNLGLRYFFRTAREHNISLKAGVRVNEFPPVVYLGPRFSFTENFDPWVFRFTQNVTYYTDSKWQARTIMDFERQLTDVFFLRTTAEGAWFEEEDGYYYELKGKLFQTIDADRALEYQWNNYFETRPSHQLDELLLAVKYRQRFWREWLFFEIAPQVAFREEDDYDPTPGITFAIEGFFGK